MNPSDEIKAKLDIVEVIREYIQLKPSGTNFQANCPFHNEKTPSFVVSPDKQIWHCFGCDRGGDVFSFIMEKEGMTFVEALRFLAPKAGVVLRLSGGAKNQNLKVRALDALELAADFYHRQLLVNAEAGAAVEYLRERGLTDQALEEWQIGYSPNSWDDLLNFLKDKGFNEAEIAAAGLASKGQSGNRFYNRFRGRIMFPINDAGGQVIAFTARQIPGREDQLGKYINSPAGPCYDKSRTLFALDKAKQAIRDSGYAVIVEGQMDAITSHLHGFKNTVASSGTALTEEQLAQLSRFADTIVLALDADSAGQAAAERAGQILGEADKRFIAREDRWGRVRSFIDPHKRYKINIKVALVPSGKDPDEAIKQSPDNWTKALRESISLAEFYFQRSLEGLNLKSLEDRKKAALRFLPLAIKLDDLDRDYWIRRLAAAIDTDAQYLYEAIKKSQTASMKQPAVPAVPAAGHTMSRDELLSRNLLALLLRFGAYIKYISDYIRPEQLAGKEHQALYKSLIIYYNEVNTKTTISPARFALDYSNFRKWLKERQAEQELSLLDVLAILGERDYFAYTEAQADAELKAMSVGLRKSNLNARRRQLSKAIADMDNAGSVDQSKINVLIKELAVLNEELRRLL